jgi:signal peptidase I
MFDDPRGGEDGSPPPDDATPVPDDATPAPEPADATPAPEPADATSAAGANGEFGAPSPAPAPSTDRPRRPVGAGSFFRELPLLLLIAFLLAFLLRTFVLQVFYIPSSSMEPTLQIDDRMVVEKITYRFREPIRGEVVVFEGDELGLVDPDASITNRVVRGVGQFLGVVPASARDFVKRVIGLPGDEVLIEDGQVYVNGVPLDEPYVVFDDGSDYGPVTVPEDHLFFLGDNRPNSSDSRRSLGFVPRDHVVGRSAVIIWPFDHAGSLLDVRHEVAEEDATS